MTAMRTARAKGEAAPTRPQSMDPEILDASRVVPFHKSTTTDRILFGVVFRPSVPDAHGDEAEPAVVRKAAHDFLAGYGVDNGLSIQHSDMDPPLSLVESYVAEEDGEPHGVQVMKGDWAIGVRVDDDALWAESTGEDRKYTGFSIGGIGRMQAVSQEDGAEPVSKSESGEIAISKAADGSAKPKLLRKYLSASIQHIALVDAGANQLVNVPIVKRLNMDPKTPAAEVAAPTEVAAPVAAKVPDPIVETPKPVEPAAAEPVAKAKRITPKRLAEAKAILAAHAALVADMETADPEEASDEAPAGEAAPVAKAAEIKAQTIDIAAIVQEAVSKALVASDEKHAAKIDEISKANAAMKSQLDEIAAVRPLSKSASGDSPAPTPAPSAKKSVFESLFTPSK